MRTTSRLYAPAHAGDGSDINGIAPPPLIATPPAAVSMPPTTQVLDANWVNDASGNWSGGVNWSTQVIEEVDGQPEIVDKPVEPSGNYDVSISPGGTTPFKVTFDTTDRIDQLSGAATATLAINGGTLTIADGGSFGGTVDVQGGVLDLETGWGATGGFLLGPDGTVEIGSGSFNIGAGTLSGTVTGGGDLYFAGGATYTLTAGFASTTGTLELGVNGDGFGSVVVLKENVSYAGTLLIDNYSGNNAELDLNGHNFSATGNSELNGTVEGPGTLTVHGQSAASISAYDELTLADGATVSDQGTITQNLNVSLDGTISVAAGAVWDIDSDSGIDAGGTILVLKNAGTFAKTFGTAISYVDANVTNTGTFLASTGTLQVDGSFANSGLISGGDVVVQGAFSGSGRIDVGTLTLTGGGTVGGKLTGTGLIDLVYSLSGYTLAAATPLTLGTLEVSSTTLTLSSGESFAGSFDLANGGVAEGSYALSLTGTTSLDGTVASTGRLTTSDATITGFFELSGDATWLDTGSITQNSNAQLGGGSTDKAVVSIGAGDIYNITGAYDLGNPNIDDTGLATITNAGLFEMTGTTGAAQIFNSNFTSTGTLLTDSGLVLDGPKAVLGGYVEGSGTLYLSTAWTLDAGTKLTVSYLQNYGAGTLTANTAYGGVFLQGGNGTLNLGQRSLTLTGADTLSGGAGGTGTLTLKNAVLNGFYTYGTSTLVDSHSVSQQGSVTIGSSSSDSATLDISAGATWSVVGNNQWLGNPNQGDTGQDTINNAGLFTAAAGNSIDVWHSDFINTGTLLAGGSIYLGGNTATLGGSLAGAGYLELGTSWTLESTASVTVSQLDNEGAGTLTAALSYDGTFTNGGGASLDLAGQTLKLTGPASLSGSIGNGGTLALTDATLNNFTLYGDATLVDTGSISQQGSINIGDGNSDGCTLNISAGGTWSVAGNNQWLGNPNQSDTGQDTINNSGVFTASAGNSVDVWHSDFTNTGTLLANGSIDLAGNIATLGGSLAGTGYLELATAWTLQAAASVTVSQLDNEGTGTLTSGLSYAGTYTNGGNATLALAGQTLTLTDAANLAGIIDGSGALALGGTASVTLDGNFDVDSAFTVAAANAASIALAGDTLTLAGATTLAPARGSLTVGGAGTLALAGAASLGSVVVGGGSLLSVTSATTQIGKLTLGSAAGAGTLVIGSAGVFDVKVGQGIAAAGNGDAITNAGLFEKTAGTSKAVIAAAFTNTGTVEVTSGSLVFTGGFTNSGVIIGKETTSNGTVTISASGADLRLSPDDFGWHEGSGTTAALPGAASGMGHDSHLNISGILEGLLSLHAHT